MCTSHLTKEQATELADTILNDLEALEAQPRTANEIEDLLMAAIIQNIVKIRDGYINVH